MKQNFRFEQTNESSKKQNKQEVIEYLLNKEYGSTITNEELGSMLGYNIDDDEEYHKYKAIMTRIKNFLLKYGKVLKSIPSIGYYILKPSQISQHCYRTYIKSASRLYDKSAYVLERTDKTGLNTTRMEEINNMISLNQQLIEQVENVITESAYYSRKAYYDSLES